MIRHGSAPYLECSSKGDKRFSAFYARVRAYDHKTIEELFQGYKVFEDGTTGLSIKEAKGRKAVNYKEASVFYDRLWSTYIEENPEFLQVLKHASGLSDVFGQPGHACQATSLWNIRNKSMATYDRFIHSSYVRTADDRDAVVAKIHRYDENGNVTPILKIFDSPKRTIFLTKPEYRNHPFKKESEKFEFLERHVVNNATMAPEIKALLEGPGDPSRPMIPRKSFVSLKQVNKSPYVWGTDVPIETLIKHQINKKFAAQYKGPIAPITTGFFDTETDIEKGDILCATVTHENKIYTAIREDFMFHLSEDGTKTPATVEELQKVYTDLFPQYVDSLNDKAKKAMAGRVFVPTFKVVKTSAEIIVWLWSKVHENKTDFLGVWNIEFDIKKVIDALKHEGIKLTDVICSPEVPKEIRKCEFVLDMKDVDHITKKWHWLHSTAHTVILDSMCLYSSLRTVKGKEPSYRLDDILIKEVGAGKLYFTDDKMPQDMTTGDWHRYMQKHHPLFYIVYNQIDCVSLQITEWKNKDLSQMFGLGKDTPFVSYTRQTKKMADDLHFYCLEKLGEVIASTPATARTEFDNYITSAGGAVLAPERSNGSGAHLLVDRPSVETMIHPHTVDADLKSSYPTICGSGNISKDTKTSTILSINGSNIDEARYYYSLLPATRENAVLIGSRYYGLPSYDNIEGVLSEMGVL